MTQEFDYIVVGGGCIGASIACHLARRNPGRIALLERNTFLGQESTGKCAGGVRAQFSTEVNVQLSLLSLDRFEKFEEETGHPLQLLQWGYIFLLTSDEQVAAFRQQREMWSALGMDTEWLEPDQISERFSYVNVEGVLAATLHMRDGFIDPNDIVQGYAGAARGLGVTEITGCEVTGAELNEAGNEIAALQTSQGEFVAKKCFVLATGAWTRQLGNMIGVEIPVDPYRRQVIVTKAFDGIPTPFPMTVDMGTGLYFHPESGGVLMGMSDHSEPPGFNEAVNEEFNETMLMAAMERCPVLEQAGPGRIWAGLYEITPDHHPIFDYAGGIGNCYICSGFSGHGLMHAPAAGIVATEHLLDGKSSTVDVSCLALDRFVDQAGLHNETNVI